MKRPFFAAIALTAIWSCPVAGQTRTEVETGSRIRIPERARIPDQPSVTDATRGRIIMASFARCVIDRQPNRVAQILAQPIAEDYGKAMRSLSTNECLDSGQISFRFILLRGALFTELWRRRVLAEAKHTVWKPVLQPIDLETLKPGTSEAATNYTLLWFADCVAQRDRTSSSNFVTAAIASKAEDEAFKGLRPSLGPCWTAGEPLKLNRAVLQGALAEALYRMPNAVVAPSGVTR